MVEFAAPWRVGAVAASSAGDVDGGGFGDFLLGDPGLSADRPAGMAILAMSADLGAVERVDGCTDVRLLLANFAGDADADGFTNPVDRGDDADGVADDEDVFPLDPGGTPDMDGDRVGNNADAFPADPNDGTLGTDDQLPLDASASTDTDGDGVDDSRDPFPDNPAEVADPDGDGIGDNGDVSDLFPNNAARSDLMSYRIVLDAAAEGSETSATLAGDLDRDGSPGVVIASPRQPGHGVVYVISAAGLANADGAVGGVSVRNFVCELIYKSQGTRSLVCERPS